MLLGECLGGAMYERDFARICREAGFLAPQRLTARPFQAGLRAAVPCPWREPNGEPVSPGSGTPWRVQGLRSPFDP